VAGRYLVEEPLGEGGMGIVVAARHLELGHRVALKYLRPEACRRPDLVDRFRWEGRSALRIRSEHVVRVLDAGTTPNGVPYLVMELLEGKDLATLMEERRGPLPVEEAIDYVLQACEAIAEAHALGIVHRDLKPENLFLTERPDGSPLIKVIDFGISSGLERRPEGPSPADGCREILGSPAYMSPEQVRSFEGVDARADLWSLGAVLYELVTGRLIHDDASVGALLTKTCHCAVRPPRTHQPDLPEALDTTILRCLEKDRTRRIQSVAELARALAPVAPRRSLLSIARILALPLPV
jgi:serine/threonine-protein kinase